ncbi:NUMOD4 motif-containing HNH endonuclease [Corynebacterium auriscanis]|uniref:NUMOD4 motif-containing HNH endonuclease n=1 Tax=Corynebacterium auriscanis TaxID=99807 RepID=UPI003CF8275B
MINTVGPKVELIAHEVGSDWESQNEIWKPIVGYEGLYDVSNQGRVRSLDRTVPTVNGATRTVKGKILAQSNDHHGYLWVSLKDGARRSRKSVHSLVMGAFFGKRPKGMDIAHMNDDPFDNRLVNLYYCTRSENMMDMVRNGGHFRMQQNSCANGHEFVDANLTNSKKKNGHRGCKSCERARGYLQRRKPYTKQQFLLVADAYYKQIMEEN